MEINAYIQEDTDCSKEIAAETRERVHVKQTLLMS